MLKLCDYRVTQHGRFIEIGAGGLLLGICALLGCAAGPARQAEEPATAVTLDPNSVQFVKDLTRSWGLKPLRVDGISLAVGLAGTGSDPPPSAERSVLMTEMQTRDVDKPNQVLASPGTALVMVRGQIPPGARQGDRFDLVVETPSGSDTTSLHGGWLMLARLHEYAYLNQRLSKGHIMALGQGDILTDALLEGGDTEVMRTRGRLLGGGVVKKSRGLGLGIRDEFTSVRTSARLGEAVNRRFHVYDRGSKRGVANPKRDNYIELLVHPRYRENLIRYVRVIQNIAVRESPSAQTARIQRLRSRLLEPPTAGLAAMQLEAIGDDAMPVLTEALTVADPEIRFYAAEALAYLDAEPAADVLAEIVQTQPAFRWRALTALGVMENAAAHEHLIQLLHVKSAETRYGAFRMLRKMSPSDPMIDGEIIGERFSLHTISITGPEMVHISRRERPEIVLFGSNHPLRDPVVLFAGEDIVVRGDPAGGLIVRRLTASDDEEQIRTTRRLDEVLRAIVNLGGSYSDAVQAVTEAKRTGSLESRVEYSAIPKVGRTYHRSGANENGDVDQRSQLYGEPEEAETTDDADEPGPELQTDVRRHQQGETVDLATSDDQQPDANHFSVSDLPVSHNDDDNILIIAEDEFDPVATGTATATRGFDQETNKTSTQVSEPGSGAEGSADASPRFELIDPAARDARP